MDLRRALRQLDQIEPVDVWQEARSRAENHEFHVFRPKESTHPLSRGLVAGVSLALFAVVVGLVVRAWDAQLIPGDESDGPDHLSITCGLDGTNVTATQVEAQPDGVHVVVDNQLATDPGLNVLFAGGGFGRNLPPMETTRMTLPISPGEAQVRCGGFPESESWTRIQVEDPHGLYVSHELGCQVFGDLGGIAHTASDPVEAARQALEPVLQSDDHLEMAGYPQAADRWVIVVRGARVVAAVPVRIDELGDWVSGDALVCSDAR